MASGEIPQLSASAAGQSPRRPWWTQHLQAPPAARLQRFEPPGRDHEWSTSRCSHKNKHLIWFLGWWWWWINISTYSLYTVITKKKKTVVWWISKTYKNWDRSILFKEDLPSTILCCPHFIYLIVANFAIPESCSTWSYSPFKWQFWVFQQIYGIVACIYIDIKYSLYIYIIIYRLYIDYIIIYIYIYMLDYIIHIIYIIYYILYYILYIIYYILYIIYYSIYYILYTIYYILYIIYYIIYYILYIIYYIWYIIYYILYIILHITYYILYITYYILHITYFI